MESIVIRLDPSRISEVPPVTRKTGVCYRVQVVYEFADLPRSEHVFIGRDTIIRMIAESVPNGSNKLAIKLALAMALSVPRLRVEPLSRGCRATGHGEFMSSSTAISGGTYYLDLYGPVGHKVERIWAAVDRDPNLSRAPPLLAWPETKLEGSPRSPSRSKSSRPSAPEHL